MNITQFLFLFFTLIISYVYGDAESLIPLIAIGTADAWTLHDKIKEYMGDGTVDLDNDIFKMALFLSTSNIATTAINGFATATNEHANANGYTSGGVTLTTVTWVEAAGTVTFDSDNVVWNASGGNIVARFAAIYDDTVAAPVADPIVAHCLMDNTPADVTVTDGNPLTVQIAGTGIFTSV